MHLWPIYLVIVLAVVSGIMMVLERRGLATTLTLTMKGDVKRETRFLAQYGQLVCTFITALLVWQLDSKNGFKVDEALWVAVIGATFVGTLIKRLVGRARPRSEHAGKFLGPSFKHANYRESFPSTHSASALAYAYVLSAAYPAGASTFFTLGVICAVLRYLADAHWPSDVLGGIAFGILAGFFSCRIFF